MTDILVVDDSGELAELLCLVLESEGYSVAMARNGRVALEWLGEHGLPRALLVDISMPEMDGPTMVAALAATPRWQHLPVVMMTAEQRPEARLRGLHYAGLLLKPFAIDTLLAHMSAAVAQNEAAA